MRAASDDHRSDRLHRVMDEAEALFTQEGFLHLTTDSLARRLRCSKRTIYAIAPNREKFFEAIIARRLSRVLTRIAELEDANSIEATLLGYVQASAEALTNVSPPWFRDLMRFPAGSLAVKQWEETLGEALGRVIDRGIRGRVFRKVEPRVAAEALLASVRRMIDPDLLMDLRVNAADATHQVYEIFWAGLYRGEKGARRESSRARKRGFPRA
jgi:AcrR family transcriptional regulator